MRKNAVQYDSSDEIPSLPGVRTVYEATLQDRDTWIAAFNVIDEMRRSRGGKEVYQQIVESHGNMDWGWVEETADELCPSASTDQFRTWHKRFLQELPAHDSDMLVLRLYYIATFTLVVVYLRVLHPAIMPPKWWWQEMGRIRREPYVEKSVSDIVKDAFLENRDDEAIAILLDSITEA